jgi:hypothetical protein
MMKIRNAMSKNIISKIWHLLEIWPDYFGDISEEFWMPPMKKDASARRTGSEV